MGAGEDTKTDPKQVVVGKFLLLENAQLNNPLEFQKRAGSVPLPQEILGQAPAIVDKGQGLATYINELVIADTNQLFSWSDDNDEWVEKGPLTSTEVTQFSVNRDAYNNDEQDGALHPSGQSIYSWRDVGSHADGSPDVLGVSYNIIDTSRGLTIVGPTPVGAGTAWPGSSHSKCQVFGQWFVCFYVTTTSTLRATCVPIGNPSVPVDILIAGDINASNPYYDVCPSADGTRLLFAYSNTAAALTAGYLTLALASVVPPTLTTANTVTQAISIVPDVNPTASPQTFFITYGGSTNLYFQIVTESALPSHAEALLCATAGNAVNVGAIFNTASGQPNAVVYWTVYSAVSFNRLVNYCQVANLVPGSPTLLVRSVSLAGKPFIYPFAEGGLVYVLCNYESGNNGIQNTYFLIDENGNVAAKLLALGCGGFNASGMLVETSQVDATAFQWALTIQDNLVSGVSAPAQGQLVSQGGSLTATPSPLFSQTGVESVACDFFDAAIAYARETLASTLHLTGGFLSMYDGTRVVEHSYHLWPEALTVTQTAGTALMDGTYAYIGVYEWVDAQGNFHQSAPSIAVQVVISGGPADVTVVFPTLRLTQKVGVACVVYRTEMNGTQFFRTTDPGAVYNVNDPTVDSITWMDAVPDTNLLAGQDLYTFGGVYENVSAPSCSAINVFDNRLWVLPSDNRLAPWYSKQVTPGNPVAFSDLFVFNVDPRGGDITAIAGMDLYEVFFKQTSIYQTQGSGPDATGQQNALSPAALITTDCGCSDPRSVVLMPLGLMFKSEKGIYLLDRGLGVHYIGADVAAFNPYTVVAATLVSSQNQVRFLLSNNVMLVYD